MRTHQPLPLLLLAAFAACGSTPPEYFYTLSTGLSLPPRPAGTGNSALVVSAALPDAVDRPQLVVSQGANQVTLMDQRRWAEPLRAGIARVIADQLAHQLGDWLISNREEAIGTPSCVVSLDVRRFESRPAAEIEIEMLWRVSCGGKRLTGRSQAREKVAADSYEALVAAHSRALAAISREIAQTLPGTLQ